MLRTLPQLLFARRPAVRLTNRRSRPRSAIIAGMLFVLFANISLGIAAELYTRIRDPFYGDKLVKLQAKLKNDPNSSIIMIGSSRTGFAFHGLRIEERFRERGENIVAFNFGIPASGPITHCLYLKRLLKDGVKPKLLLLELLPSMLVEGDSGPQEKLFLFGDRLTYRELSEVSRYGLDASTVRGRWREATLTPWYGLRFQLLARVVQSWIPWQFRCDWSRGTDACGWGTPIRDELTDDERAAGVRQAHAEYAALLSDWKPGGGAVLALRELLQTCRENGVPVKLVLMPEGTEFRSWYSPAVRERLNLFLKHLCEEYRCGIIDAVTWLDDRMFTDNHHQLRIGAEAFSDKLAEQLAKGGKPSSSAVLRFCSPRPRSTSPCGSSYYRSATQSILRNSTG
jgi:Protein of unknown function (DUF1574)